MAGSHSGNLIRATFSNCSMRDHRQGSRLGPALPQGKVLAAPIRPSRPRHSSRQSWRRRRANVIAVAKNWAGPPRSFQRFAAFSKHPPGGQDARPLLLRQADAGQPKQGPGARAEEISAVERTSPQLAALANGVAGHAMDFDLNTAGQSVAGVIPAILPVAETAGATPSEMLDDRFHESCHKRGIPLGFRTPTYVACVHRRTDHGSVAAGD
jgi:MmgE/PrpD N-terminal domain